MIRWDIDELDSAPVLRYRVRNPALSCGQALERLYDDPAFRRSFSELLSQAPLEAYFWELPPLTLDGNDAPFEFILADAPALGAATPDPRAFEHYLAQSPQAAGIACFPNLGGDALLISPRAHGAVAAYGHLAAFVRNGPPEQVDSLWKEVARAALETLNPEPLWLSTSGLGVPWLHVRLDRVPKYITHAPYRARH